MRPAPLSPEPISIDSDSERKAVPVVTELRAIDCTTTKDWEQWARERREYDDPMGYERSRY